MDSRNTDLEQVKLVAHALLDVEIQPTEFSPMIVSHPFTNTGIAALPDEQGNFTPADLLNDPTWSGGGKGLESRSTSQKACTRSLCWSISPTI